MIFTIRRATVNGVNTTSLEVGETLIFPNANDDNVIIAILSMIRDGDTVVMLSDNSSPTEFSAVDYKMEMLRTAVYSDLGIGFKNTMAILEAKFPDRTGKKNE